MHVLLITSEELNETDIISSCFELSQAKSLSAKGIKTAILSIGTNSTRTIIKTFILKLKGRKNNDTRTAGLSYWKLFQLVIATFFRSITRSAVTRRLIIRGIPVYEALISRNTDFYIRNLPAREWKRYALKTTSDYIRDHGKPDMIHSHSRFLIASMLALEIKRKYGVPYLITEHSSYYVRNLVNESQKKETIETIENADEVITVSKKLGEWMNSSLGKNYRYRTIPNIIDEIFLQDVPKTHRDEKRFTFLNVASLDRNKGHEMLLNAFATAFRDKSEVILKIAGTGHEMERLKDNCRDLGIKDQVFFLGRIPLERVRKEMISSDCLVIASEFETFGVVVIEAQACGKPVIA